MLDRRNARRAGRPDPKIEPQQDIPHRPTSRRRSGPPKAEDLGDEMNAQEEIIESGNGFASDVDAPPKRNAKRKRTNASSKTGVRTTEPFSFFEGLLLELMEKKECEDFLRPVLSMWNEEDIPDYRERVKRPMDLGTVKRNLKSDKYVTHNGVDVEYAFDEDAFLVDVRLIFENCMEYNEPGSGLYKIAGECLRDVNEQVAERENRKLRQQEKVKRETERKKRKAAEEQAEQAAMTARKATVALLRAKQEAEEFERRKLLEFQRREQEWRQRMEAEKAAAVASAVKEALDRHKRDPTSRTSKLVNTSSVSSDEHEGNGEVTFTFVSTKGMEKKRGRKSGVVMELEAQHDDLTRKRKVMVETAIDLEKEKQMEMTYGDKRKLCEDVAELDFVRMKAVVDILARGLNRPDIVNEIDIDLDIDQIDNKLLREIQYFLKSPAACTAREAVAQVEADITEIETKLVHIRYQKAPT